MGKQSIILTQYFNHFVKKKMALAINYFSLIYHGYIAWISSSFQSKSRLSSHFSRSYLLFHHFYRIWLLLQMEGCSLRLLPLSISRSSLHLIHSTIERRFRTVFGVSSANCEKPWRKVRKHVNYDIMPTHLLWCLHFLKIYCTEDLNRIILHSYENTIQSRIVQCN